MIATEYHGINCDQVNLGSIALTTGNYQRLLPVVNAIVEDQPGKALVYCLNFEIEEKHTGIDQKYYV